MKRALAFLTFSVACAAQTFTAGASGNLIGGMSYANPGAGVFGRAQWNPARLSVWQTVEATNDRKTYERDGWYLASTTEVGYRATRRLTPEAVMYFGRQSNSQYTKAMLSVGGGVRINVGPGLSVYGQYLAPDRLSFNRASRIIGGLDMQLAHRVFVGIGQSMVFFKQPRMGGAIDTLVGMELSARVGITFGGGER